MLLLIQVATNFVLGYLLSNRLFTYYSRIAFFVFPIAAVTQVVAWPMIGLAMSDNPDPSAIAYHSNTLIISIFVALLAIAVQAVFHFLLFKVIRNGKPN